MKILLISGHGAGDVGACGNGYHEYKLTRELVNLIAPKLRQYATVDVYNQNRNAYNDVLSGDFNVGPYDYALEVHFNAFKDPKAHGTEIFVTSLEKGITVEQGVMQRLKSYFTLRDNDNVYDGVKTTDFLVIRTLKAKGISSALLETCFITNANDMKVYQENKESIALDIVESIAEEFGLKKSVTVKHVETPKPVKKSVTEVAKDVINGKYGNGSARKTALEKAGYNYSEVQAEVNRLLGAPTVNLKSIDTIAREVIEGKWGNGSARKTALTKAGYDYAKVQAKVNQLLGA